MLDFLDRIINFLFLLTFHLLSIYSAFYPFPQSLKWSIIHLQCGRPGFNPWVWRRAWHTTPVFLPGESPQTEEPGGLQSMGLQRVGHDWGTKHNNSAFWDVSPTLSSYLLLSLFVWLNIHLFGCSRPWLQHVTCGVSFPNQRLNPGPCIGSSGS